MKKLNTYTNEQILNFVFESEKLTSKFDNYIHDCEMDYISEKLNCFETSIDYSIGVCNHNYLKIVDTYEFLNGVYKSIINFGCSNKLDKLYKQCEKLYNTNLFGYMCDKLALLYYRQEIKPCIDCLEKLSFSIYQKENNADLLDYIDCFAHCFLQNIYINNENEIIEIIKH